MKVEVLQENFAKALSLTSRFVSSRAQLPVLSNVLLSAKGTKLHLSATNLEISLSTSIGAKVEEEGEITIPARVLTDLITNLSKGPLTLSANKEQLEISSIHFSGNILGLNSSEFPKVPSTINSANSIETKDFIKALNQTTFSSSSDITRPILTGVLFTTDKDNNLQLVGTDGFRLSRKEIKLKQPLSFGKVIVPKTALLELPRIFSDDNTISFEIREEEKQILFGNGDTVLSSRVIEGDFPPYEKIIPTDSKIEVKLSKDELLRAVKVASVIARDNGYVAKIVIKEGTLEINSESSSSGSQNVEVEAKVEGGTLEILYNIHFVEEFLNVVDGEEIVIYLTGSESPGVLRDSSDTNLLHLIMPVKV